MMQEWCVFYAYGGVGGNDFNMSILRAPTAEEAAEQAAGEYGGDAKRWVVKREDVRLFSVEEEWRPASFKVKAEESVQ